MTVDPEWLGCPQKSRDVPQPLARPLEATARIQLPKPRHRRILVAKDGVRNWVPPRHQPKRGEWRRVLDMVQAFAFAVLASAGFVYFLSALAAKMTGKIRTEPIEVRVSPSEKNTETEASSSASSARKFSQKSTQTENPDKIVQEAYQAAALSSFSLPVSGLPSAGVNFDSGLEDFGMGSALGKAGSMRGVGIGNLGALFENEGLGDGSEMLIYVDNSRSMWRHGRRVTDMVKRLFPYARIAYIEGCAIVPGSGIVQVLSYDSAPRSKVYFVCDLRDPITYEGLEALRIALGRSKPNRELHIISFENRPPLDLLLLVKETFGSVTMVKSEP